MILKTNSIATGGSVTSGTIVASNVDWHLSPKVSYAGSWEIAPHTLLDAEQRPNWLRRTLVRWILGWTWVDA